MKSILLEWREISDHAVILNVPDQFDLNADNDGIYDDAVCEISDSAFTTYQSGCNEAFRAAAVAYRPKAEAMFIAEDVDDAAAADPGTADSGPVAGPIMTITNSDIRYARRAAGGQDKRVYSVLPDDPEKESGIEVCAETDEAVSVFLSALAEITGHTLADLTRGGYIDNDEEPNPAEEIPCWHYFPHVLIVAEQDDTRQATAEYPPPPPGGGIRGFAARAFRAGVLWRRSHI